MRRCHIGDVSTFIYTILDFTSDLYSLPRTYTIYLGHYGINLGQCGFHLGQHGFYLGQYRFHLGQY